MISVLRTAAAPEQLVLKGTAELDLYRSSTAEARKKLKFRAYKVKGVGEELERMFHGKCAYCESRLAHVTSADVEHWRPKGKILATDGYVDGYWWLAAEWTNLFPACPHCNRPTKHKTPAGKPTAGKGMRFPLDGPRTAAPEEGDEATERALLLNPCDPNPTLRPEAHLEFATAPEIDADKDLAGVIRAVRDASGGDDPLGAESIEVFALNRDALVFERKQLLEDIRLAIFNINRAMTAIESQPRGSDGEAAEIAAIERNEGKLKSLLSERAEYLLLARQFATEFLAELERLRR